MDEQTMRDYIEDLLAERTGLYEQINKLRTRVVEAEKEVDRLEKLVSREY